MPRSKNLSSYPMRYYETVEVAARIGELRLEFSTPKRAKSEALQYYGFRNAINLHLQNTKPDEQSSAAQRAAVFLRDLEFPVEGSTLVLRKTTMNEAEIAANRALAAFKHRQGFQQAFHPHTPDVEDPQAPPLQEPSTPDLSHDAEFNRDLESAREKLTKFVDPSLEVLRALGYTPKDKDPK